MDTEGCRSKAALPGSSPSPHPSGKPGLGTVHGASQTALPELLSYGHGNQNSQIQLLPRLFLSQQEEELKYWSFHAWRGQKSLLRHLRCVILRGKPYWSGSAWTRGSSDGSCTSRILAAPPRTRELRLAQFSVIVIPVVNYSVSSREKCITTDVV